MKNISIKLAIPTLFTLAFLGFSSTSVKADSIIYDQTNDYFSPICGGFPCLFNSIQFYSPIGQEFVPTFNSLNVVELFTQDFEVVGGTGASLFTNIRSNTITGTIVGTSSLVTLPNYFNGITQFYFPSVVPLTPNQQYVIEVKVALGNNWGVGSRVEPNSYSTYPYGTWIIQGQPDPETDLWFREGIKTTPEPTFTLGFLALGTLGAASTLKRKLKP